MLRLRHTCSLAVSVAAANFSDITFEDIVVHSAGDAAIGIVVMDGGTVAGVTYRNITANNVTSPLQFYIGARRLAGCPPTAGAPTWSKPCPPYPPGGLRPAGTIRDIIVDGLVATQVLGTGHGLPGRNWTTTLDGQPPDQHGNCRVSDAFARTVGPNITLRNMDLSVMGGGRDSGATPHHLTDGWMNIGPVKMTTRDLLCVRQFFSDPLYVLTRRHFSGQRMDSSSGTVWVLR